MNVLLVHPRFPDTFWSFRHALRFVGKRAALPPLGLLTVAAMLPRTWAKRLADLNVRELRPADLAWADLVLVSAMTVQRDSVGHLLERCRQAEVRVVAGGPLFTTEHEEIRGVDHFVLDEAEMTLPRFLDDLARGRPRSVYRAEGFADVRSSPTPLWSIAELPRYASASVQYSRGCPFDCEFCNVTTLFGRRSRTKTTEQVLAELDELHRCGWREGIFFVDDNFIGRRKKLKAELLPALAAWRKDKPGTSFLTEASIDLADDEELVALMVAAGFDTVFIGVETPDEKSLLECGKHQNRNRDVVADVRRLHRAGLQVQGGFILGFDHDTDTIFERQASLIQGSGIVTAMLGILQALPGTKLFERMRREGRLIGRTTGDNVDGTTNIRTRMQADVLRAGYHDVLRRLYRPREYYRRVRTFLRDYRPSECATGLTPGRIAAFLRSLVGLGVVARERLHYWGLLAWTLFRRPRSLPVAVRLAIYGHHFRKVAEGHVGATGRSPAPVALPPARRPSEQGRRRAREGTPSV